MSKSRVWHPQCGSPLSGSPFDLGTIQCTCKFYKCDEMETCLQCLMSLAAILNPIRNLFSPVLLSSGQRVSSHFIEYLSADVVDPSVIPFKVGELPGCHTGTLNSLLRFLEWAGLMAYWTSRHWQVRSCPVSRYALEVRTSFSHFHLL